MNSVMHVVQWHDTKPQVALSDNTLELIQIKQPAGVNAEMLWLLKKSK